MLDLFRQRDQGFLQRHDLGLHRFHMGLQHGAACAHRGITLGAKSSELHHFANGHARRAQPIQERDPSLIADRVPTMTARSSGDRPDQAGTLVVAQRVWRKPAAIGHLPNRYIAFHDHLTLQVRARSKSSRILIEDQLDKTDASMLTYTYFGTNDLGKAIVFYDATLSVLGMKRCVTGDPEWDRVAAGWGIYEGGGARELAFWVGTPF